MFSTSADTSLTPSEVVFLMADRFASEGRVLDKYRMLGKEVDVSKRQLSVQIFAAALVANQTVGAIELRAQERKALLGLRTTRVLLAEPTSAATRWPEGCLERAIISAAEETKAYKGRNEVRKIVFEVLKEDQVDPHSFAIDAVKHGLVRRGLVTKTEQKKLKVFSVSHYSLPEETLHLAALHADSVTQLLGSFRNSRPSEWSLLLGQIETGIQLRRAQDDSDAGD